MVPALTADPRGASRPTPELPVARPARESRRSWPLADRIFYWACWATGIGLCLIAAWIVIYMGVKGVSFLRASMLFTSPKPEITQQGSGGFSDPIVGTFIIVAIGTALAVPVGMGIAVWLSEYARPRWLARTVESALETLAGVPSVVLALFALLVFSQGFLGFLSESSVSGGVTGTSFLSAGIAMGVLAAPLVVAANYEALALLPSRLREGSHALGKTRITTVRHVLLPAIRPASATGAVLAMGRIVGDTAIITILLGGGVNTEPNSGFLGLLRGTGATLTSYVFYESPAGEGNSHEKAYAAAFVLLLIVLALNGVAVWIARDRTVARRSIWSALGWKLPWTG
jgi:phosphate transport system permease protein